MNKKALNKWSKEVQVDKRLKVLADLKTYLEKRMPEVNYEWEAELLIIKVEKECANIFWEETNQILKICSEMYTEIGRNSLENDGFEIRLNCLIKIKGYLDTIEIPTNYLLISKMRWDENDDEMSSVQ
jgi:hypothetical protein